MSTAPVSAPLSAGLLELADYRAVVLLLEEGNVRRAAARFGTTQPALSMRLQRIEARLEQALFVRGPAGLRATAAGELLGGHARGVLREAARAEAALCCPPAVARSAPARLLIGAVPCAERTVLPALARRFPATELCVRTMPGADQPLALRAGEIDLGLAYLPLAGRALLTRELARYEVRCAVPAQHPAAHATPARLPAQLHRLGFLLFDARLAPALHARCVALLDEWRLPVRATHQTDRLETLLHLVAAGRGAALVPDWAESLPVEGVVYRSLPAPERTVAMGAVVSRHGPGPRWLQALG